MIFTLMAFLFSLSLQAANVQLSISSATDISYVTLNGRKYNVNGRNNELSLSNLTVGRYQVKIYVKERGGRNGRFQTDKLMYQGNIQLRNGYHTDVYVNRFGRVFTDNVRITRNGGFNPGNGRWGFQPISSSGFLSLKNAIKNAGFDQTKLTIAKQASEENDFTTDQVKELMDLFSFESSKIDLAKTYYESVIDQDRYTDIYNTFAFSSSKEELAKFISGD